MTRYSDGVFSRLQTNQGVPKKKTPREPFELSRLRPPLRAVPPIPFVPPSAWFNVARAAVGNGADLLAA
jgi:hypothetical protein